MFLLESLVPALLVAPGFHVASGALLLVRACAYASFEFDSVRPSLASR